MFWRDITLSVWRKKTTGLKTKKRLLPLVLAAALCSSPVWAEEATFTANFKDTDLKSFIETVGANLNKTIIMGQGVQGKVSIRTMTPLNERQYYQLFLNLLEAQGYAVVPMENDVLKVVKSSAAKVEPLPLVGEGSDNYAGDEMVTKVVPVRNVSVRELAPILRQMIDSAGSGNVVNYDPSNVIMLTGRASVVERLTEVIQRVDHAGNRTEEVIPLDNASASEIARVLESLTKNSGENQPATLKSQIVADERTNSVIVSGDPATRDKMRRLIRRLDSEMERSGNSQVFYLKYSKAEDLVDVLKQVSGTLTAAKEEAEGTVGSGREIVSIAASKHSNALIVTAPQDIMQSLQSVIEQLDIRRAQVHVEALIVEVAEGSNINFGVQWASKDAGLMQFANGTQIPIGTLGAAISQAKPQKGSTVISENGATTINPDTNGDLSTLAQLLSGFSGTAVGVVKGDWMALVQAVKNDSSSNVLSTPSITTLDNQEAFFMVGQDVPVLTGSTVGSNNSNPFNTVERKKVGIMLKVTPQINEGNAVQMVIEQEVSKVEGQTSLDVVFGERKLKTTVLANDGELIVLGGLMDDQAGESVAKVPLLGDIPLIGNLFKSTADKKEKRNLMVFIRPTILHVHPLSLSVLQELQRGLNAPFTLRQIDEAEFEQRLNAVWQRDSSEARQLMEDLGSAEDFFTLAEELPETEDLLESDDDAPIIKLINAMLAEAIKEGASDIHIETFEKSLVIRFRVDGTLHEMLRPGRKLASLLVSRIKVMARLDIAEKRVPQDGRIALLLGGRAIDVRVSTMPSAWGERVVLRLLDKNQARLTLERLGLSQQLTAQLRQLLHKPHGIFLVTGPTGSGKSTTLYAGLQELNNHSRNILTVEDPIEYMIEGIGQTQVNTRVGMTFARGLRAILRQDPDVVMVGEIRDTETAEIAVQASLTGHLVLSTLHTNTAVGAITRLQDMGVEPFLLSSSLTGVMAQRLVRTLCPDCRQPAPATDEEKRLLGITDARTVTLYHPQGCPACNHKGFRGRTAIHELIVVDATLRDLIHRQAGELELERYVRQHSAGIRSNGIEKVLAGETSLDEVLRVTMEA
ncbi:type II secretion system ATPase GspE [Escherichia coli]|nr:type II secretion system ATPase GspE [Escherichia coli]MCK2659106.1 type II secretion system ATPase GspE [Escherichia coli]MCK2754776.1 type II secretion system ATPase GspE [Escherichia coli]MCK3270052.1 type II secretion system ATPase GspE [Escherichia coli]